MIQFHVAGTPVPQGAITYNKAGFGYHANNKALKLWRDQVRKVAGEYCAFNVVDTKDQAVILTLGFIMPRGKTVKRRLPTVRPDLDHLIRSIGDALTGVAFLDDSQVVSYVASKSYINPIMELEIGVVIGIEYVPNTDLDSDTIK